MRVLIVDDDASIRRWTRRLLPRFDTGEASTAAEALATLDTSQWDAALIDVCLGGGSLDRSGLDLVRELRARNWCGAVILCSGRLDAETGGGAAAASGAEAFLIKADYDGVLLRSTIEEAVAVRVNSPKGPKAAEPTAPACLRAPLGAYLDAAAEEEIVHAETAYRLACFARTALRGGDDVPGTEACARLVGVTAETLRLYALVASRWTNVDLYDILVVRRTADGGHVSISHLAELAKLPRHTRENWLQRVFAEALTVRNLRRALLLLEPRRAT